MQAPVPLHINQQSLWLSAERCVYIESVRSLVLSDLHFGKTGHFRKSGIAVPQKVFKEDLQRLFQQVQYFQPRQLVIVGDLFHSDSNKEHELFKRWREDIPAVEIILVKGNHDLLEDRLYVGLDIRICHPWLSAGAFSYIHDISALPELEPVINNITVSQPPGSNFQPQPTRRQSPHSNLQLPTYFFSGHLHPGIRISGVGKQSLCFPCFYFGEQYAILPAFGRFTGMAMIEPNEGDNVFAIVDNKLVQFQ